jgi:2-polyprenyl-3-methyl-5-hydroxy-6-metoxy-1,4-benzoquinol methylase
MDTVTNDPPGPVSIDVLVDRIHRLAAQRRHARDESTNGNGHGADGRGVVEAQSDFNRATVQAMEWIGTHLGEAGRRAEEAEARIREEFRAALEGLRREFEEREGRIAQEAIERETRLAAELGERIDHLAARLEALERLSGRAEEVGRGLEERIAHRLDEVRMRVLRAERRLRSLGAPSDVNVAPRVDGAAESTQATSLDGVFDYFMFEHRFRGSVEDIKRRQSAYLDLFRGRTNVLDLGCGRGEFVEVLGEAGVPVRGVDSNRDMVEFCRDRGLPVEEGDLFAYLEGVADGSLDGLFAAQVVEHLPPRQIVRLVELCERKLRPGGLMVLETINPTCLEAMNWFYLDPSHVRPVPAGLLQFVAEQAGFRAGRLRFSAPVEAGAPPILETSEGVPAEAEGYQDYALVAER